MKSIFAKKVYTGNDVLENQLISIENGKITFIGNGVQSPEIKSVYGLAPGFTDIHINGGSNFHFTQKPDTETIADIDLSSARLGTAYTLPSLITSPMENIFKGIEAVRNYKIQNPDSGVIGMHLEGPFIHPEKRGAHLTEYILKPTNQHLEEIIRHGKDVIRLITIAPEVFNTEQIELLLSSGITVSIGHSNADYTQAMRAFKQGIGLVTHLYNAMPAFNHRKPGLVGAIFDSPDVYAPIILDGSHCDFSVARIAWKIKSEKLFLISDALFTERKKKQFKWGNFNSILQDGAYVNSEGNLSGAAISLAEAVQNAVHEVGIPLQEAIEMATIRPALALGLSNTIGRIAKGYPARFTTFDENLSRFEFMSL